VTREELKQDLLGKSYPNEVCISADQVVVDVSLFLRIQFIELDQWAKDITKCPAYVRLMKFKEAVKLIN